MMFPSDMKRHLDELAIPVEQFFPAEPEKAFNEFVGWGKGNIIASIAFNIAWEHLTFLHTQANPILSTRPMHPTDLTSPSIN